MPFVEPEPPPDLRRDSKFSACREWRPFGGAFAASVLLHALALVGLATILASPSLGDPRGPPQAPIAALLVSAGDSKPVPAAAPSSLPPRGPALGSDGGSTAVEGIPRPDARTPLSSPWSGTSIDTSLPLSTFGSGMIAEGVESWETRNLVQIGEAIERRILAGFRGEPDRPITLKSDVPIGYPLDALAQGVEGRVLVWFVVDAEGAVVEREIIDGPTELAAWTLRRLDRLVDRPAFQDNQPVRAWMALEIVFDRSAIGAAATGPQEATADVKAASAPKVP